MRSTRRLIHEGRPNAPAHLPLLHFLRYGFIGVDRVLRQALHVHLSFLQLPDLQTLWRRLLPAREQILDLLVVDLEHADLDLVLNVFVFVGVDPFKDLITGLWNDTLVLAVTDHWVRLAAAGLSVRKQAAMVALPRVIQDLLTERLINIVLVRIYRILILRHINTILVRDEAIMRVETVVKGERPGLPIRRVDYRRHRPVHFDDAAGADGPVLRITTRCRLHGPFALVEGADAHCNFDTHCELMMWEVVLFNIKLIKI